ncbi:MAG: ATP-binding protein, partial [Flavobacteriales bacterium]
GTTQDITARRWQEEEVQRFFDLAVDLFCIASSNGYFLRTSRSFTTALGYSETELREKPFVELVHPDDRGKTLEEVDFLLRGGTSRNFENRYLHKSGEYVILSWTATFDVESHLIYASAKDVTERKELEQNLLENQIEAEKSRAKDTFLANMSHEIRTPLNAIIGFNDILSQTTLTEEQRKNVDFIGNASKTLSVLINDILDISKLESGKLDLEHEPFEIEKVVRQVVHMHASKAKAKGIKLMLNYDTEIPDVLMGDETRLSQILINLISNAIKFTESGSVEVRVVDAKQLEDLVSVQFEVKDTGIGIRKDKLDLIFERFTQAESYTTRIYGGTGLGLNIVQSLVELHHGKLDVKSEWGVGSTFSFTIDYPIAGAADLKSLEDGRNLLETARLEGMSILLVEDNEHNQILAETYLTKHHATVEIASNGNIALGLLKNKSYDVILMDIQMPIMDGLATTVLLRKEMRIETPVVACSAHAMASERQKCREAGMNDYISKPYTEEILVNTLAKYRKAGRPMGFELSDDFKSVIGDLERNISKTYADKIVGIFKQRLPHEIHLIRQAIDERDMKLMEERAHYQAGSMSSLRFTQGYQLAHAAELAAQEKQLEKAVKGSERLMEYLSNLLHFLNTGLNESRPGEA